MTLPQNEPNSQGVAAGLQTALFALLVFWLLGYEVHVSIFWGALAGVAMGRIVYWWELKDEPVVVVIPDDDSLEDVARDRRRQTKIYARNYRSRRRSFLNLFRPQRLTFWKKRNPQD
jgi:hypothetical protein